MLSPAKLLFIGQAPSRTSDGSRPFSGESGRRFSDFLQVTQEEMLEMFEFRNLFDTFPGPSPSGKGDRFPRAEARKLALQMLPKIRGRHVVFIGASVAYSFGIPVTRYNEWLSSKNPLTCIIRCAVVAHPSGVSRMWNDRSFVEETRLFFQLLKQEYARTT